MDLYFEPWEAGIREAWIESVQGMADAIGSAMLIGLFVLVPMAVLLAPRRQRRRIVCPLRGQAMHVQFDAWGVPGVLWSATVRSCSAFDPPTAVHCDGACLRGSAGRSAGTLHEGGQVAGRGR